MMIIIEPHWHHRTSPGDVTKGRVQQSLEPFCDRISLWVLRNSKAAVIIDDICVLKCFIGTKTNVSCPINTHTHTLWYLFSVFSGPLASTHTGQVALMIYIQNKLKFNRKLSNRTFFSLLFLHPAGRKWWDAFKIYFKMRKHNLKNKKKIFLGGEFDN